MTVASMKPPMRKSASPTWIVNGDVAGAAAGCPSSGDEAGARRAAASAGSAPSRGCAVAKLGANATTIAITDRDNERNNEASLLTTAAVELQTTIRTRGFEGMSRLLTVC